MGIKNLKLSYENWKSCCFTYFRSVISGNDKCYRTLRSFYIFTAYNIKLVLIAIFKRTHLHCCSLYHLEAERITEADFYIKVIEAGVLLNCSCEALSGQKLMQSSAHI